MASPRPFVLLGLLWCLPLAAVAQALPTKFDPQRDAQRDLLLHPQETGSLEAGRDYDQTRFLAFLRAWIPPRPS
jgi:hypothetical protein